MINHYNEMTKTCLQNRRMKLKKELRAVKEINEQERKKRDEPGEHHGDANHHHHHNHDDANDNVDDDLDLDPDPDHDPEKLLELILMKQNRERI